MQTEEGLKLRVSEPNENEMSLKEMQSMVTMTRLRSNRSTRLFLIGLHAAEVVPLATSLIVGAGNTRKNNIKNNRRTAFCQKKKSWNVKKRFGEILAICDVRKAKGKSTTFFRVACLR